MSSFSCPKCGGDTQVIDSRGGDDNGYIRRRRRCFDCTNRFSTFEIKADQGAPNFVDMTAQMLRQAERLGDACQAMIAVVRDVHRLTTAWRDIHEGRAPALTEIPQEEEGK